MMTYRITLEAVLDIEAENEEEALDKLPESVSLNEMYILDVEEG